MKKILSIVFVLFAIYANSQTKEIKLEGNFIVATDVNTGFVDWEYPAGALRVEFEDTTGIRFKNIYTDKLIPRSYGTYIIDSLVDAQATPYTYNSLFSFTLSSTGNVAQNQSVTGWSDNVDTEYTELNPFVVLDGEKRTLPNNAGIVRDSEKPLDVDQFYNPDDSTITGRNGDAILVTIEFTVKPTTNSGNINLRTSIDIGGAVGEIYFRDFRLPRGLNEPHFYLSSFGAYTLDTWEANGGKILVQAEAGDVDIYNIRVVVTRTHKAR